MVSNLKQASNLIGILNYGDQTETTQAVTLLQTITAVFICLILLVAVVVSAFYEEAEIDHADQTVYSARDYTGEYLSEGAAREWSTVVKIFIPPPSFKPVLLSFSRSPLL